MVLKIIFSVPRLRALQPLPFRQQTVAWAPLDPRPWACSCMDARRQHTVLRTCYYCDATLLKKGNYQAAADRWKPLDTGDDLAWVNQQWQQEHGAPYEKVLLPGVVLGVVSPLVGRRRSISSLPYALIMTSRISILGLSASGVCSVRHQSLQPCCVHAKVQLRT